jgi:hypothetical protein
MKAGTAFHFGAVVSILDSHRRDPGSIPCNVTFCPNLEIVTHEGWDCYLQ